MAGSYKRSVLIVNVDDIDEEMVTMVIIMMMMMMLQCPWW